ncbi:hypothetical protein (partial), partial [Pectobacterium atrosepticum SCRI1043]
MGAIEAIPVPPDDAAGSNAQSRASFIALLGVAGPPMAAAFFGARWGSSMSYAQVNGGGSVNRPGPQGQPPGSWSGAAPPAASTVNAAHSNLGGYRSSAQVPP